MDVIEINSKDGRRMEMIQDHIEWQASVLAVFVRNQNMNLRHRNIKQLFSKWK
jgi:hypothetical protein